MRKKLILLVCMMALMAFAVAALRASEVIHIVTSGDSLLKSHNVDMKQYEASMDYYGSRQEIMKEIYSQALEDLNEELSDLETTKE